MKENKELSDKRSENDWYFPSFTEILQAIGMTRLGSDEEDIAVPVRIFKFLLSRIAGDLPFDPDYYSRKNADLRQAVKTGELKSLHEHFVNVGFFEGRQGAPLPVDDEWYLSNYPDVARAYARGQVANLSEHLNETGRYEGRSGSALQAAERQQWMDIVKALANR